MGIARVECVAGAFPGVFYFHMSASSVSQARFRFYLFIAQYALPLIYLRMQDALPPKATDGSAHCSDQRCAASAVRTQGIATRACITHA
jgi:hypothetical protein